MVPGIQNTSNWNIILSVFQKIFRSLPLTGTGNRLILASANSSHQSLWCMASRNENMNSCGMDMNRINKERSCCSITRILKVGFTFIFSGFHVLSLICTLLHHWAMSVLFCSVETEWKWEKFVELSRKKFNGKIVFYCVLLFILLNFFSDFKWTSET